MAKFVPNAEALSPLRYPGGKALLACYISGVIEENYLTGCTLYEPYAGGASVSLELLRLGFVSESVLVERDPLIFAFWWSVINEPAELCAGIRACPVTLDTWYDLLPTRDVVDPHSAKYSLVQLGLAGLFYNRTNFSGIVGAGPIGGKSQASSYKLDCRFNKDKLIGQVEAIKPLARRIKVHWGDAVQFLRERVQEISTGFSFAYIDPPYYQQGRRLYRHFYTDAEHATLADYIREQGYPWLLSYDDHPRIRDLYAAPTHVQQIFLDYKVKSSRRARELVISNLEIPPPVYGHVMDSQADLFTPEVIGR